ncbi:hypothetical protein FRC01_007162 [Tulasnella sp. 417]|nr:hypothetical protein FRC01_007162 [Tulasnella sp. 417]
MSVTPINSLQQFQTIINSGKPVVIDFWATCSINLMWMAYPYVTGSTLLNLEKDPVVLKFSAQDASEEAGIRAMPTFTVFKDGQKIDELVGASPERLEKRTFGGHTLRRNSGKVIATDYYGDLYVAPLVERLSGKYTDAEFYKVNVDDVLGVAQDQGVSAMPTFILYKDGEIVIKVVGPELRALESALISARTAD